MLEILVELSIACLLLQGTSQLIGKFELKKYMFSACLFLSAYTQFYFYLVQTKDLIFHSNLFMSYVPCLLLLGPLLRSYFNILIKEASFFKLKNVIHFVLPVFGFFYYSQYFLLSKLESSLLISNLYLGINLDVYTPISFLCGLSLLLYGFIILKEQPKVLSRDSVLNKPLLFGWWCINLLYIFLATLSLFSLTTSLKISFLGNYVASLFIVAVFVINIRYPEWFKTWLFELKKKNRSRKYLANIDPNIMLNTIKEKMILDKLYTNSELSLQGLSDYVHLTRYQLSELLNDYADMSFHDFVGYYRVEAAKRLLENDPWKKNIAIGYDVGFNSQTMFNKTFKKWVKLTPSAYQNLKKKDAQKDEEVS
jgi:AraC-like DNA-binding protein